MGVLRVAFGGQHHGDRILVVPFQRRQVGQRPRRHGVQDLTKRGFEQRQDRLGFGVAEAAVEFHHCRTVRPPGQSGIQQTGVGAPPPHKFFRHRHTHLVHNSAHPIGRQPGQRAVRPHPTRIGALVAVPYPFVILSGD